MNRLSCEYKLLFIFSTLFLVCLLLSPAPLVHLRLNVAYSMTVSGSNILETTRFEVQNPHRHIAVGFLIPKYILCEDVCNKGRSNGTEINSYCRFSASFPTCKPLSMHVIEHRIEMLYCMGQIYGLG